MSTGYDERLNGFWRWPSGNYIVKMIEEDGVEDEVKNLNTMPLHLGSFVLPNSQTYMNNFIHATIGFYTNDLYYGDTDPLNIENIHWNKLDEAKVSVKGLLQGKNDYEDGGIFYEMFLAPKIKYCVTINKYVIRDEHKTFKGFTNVSDNLYRKEYFKMLNGDKLIAKMPSSWKKGFDCGLISAHTLGYRKKYINNTLCDKCGKLVNQTKEFSAHLNDFKRQPLNSFAHMLPWYAGDSGAYVRKVPN